MPKLSTLFRSFAHAMSRANALLLFLALTLPALALAQAAAAPAAPSFFSGLFTTENLIGAAVVIVGGIFGGSQLLTAVRKRRIALGAYHAFHMVEDIANETEGEDIFDKAKFGLSKLNEYFVAHGWRPLKPEEEALAKLAFSSLHGKQIAEAKVQANAMVSATRELDFSTPARVEVAKAIDSVPT